MANRNQKIETPDWLINGIEMKLLRNHFSWDLAASYENNKAVHCFTESDDSLKQDWNQCQGFAWLNSPFKNVGQWIEKASRSTNKIVQICELSGDRNRDPAWFGPGYSQVVIVHGRVWPEVRSTMLILWRCGFPNIDHCYVEPHSGHVEFM